MRIKQTEIKLLLGTILTNVADSIFYIYTIWYFNERYESPVFMAVVFSLVSFVDAFSFLFGPLIDRWSPKQNVFYMSLAQTMISAILFILTATVNLPDFVRGLVLVVLLLLTYIASSIVYPSGRKLIPTIVEKKNILKVNSLFETSQRVLDIFFNAISTLLITFVEDKIIVAVILVAFILATNMYRYIANIKSAVTTETSDYSLVEYCRDMKEGIQTTIENKKVLGIFVPIVAVNFFYGIAMVGLPVMAKEYVSDKAYGYGSLLICSSLGGVVGTAVIGRMKNALKKYALVTFNCLFFAGIAWLGMTFSLKFHTIIAFIFIFVCNASICMMNVVFAALIQVEINSNILGRVSTFTESLVSVMIPCGSILGGVMLLHFSLELVETLYGVALMICSFFYLMVKWKEKKNNQE